MVYEYQLHFIRNIIANIYLYIRSSNTNNLFFCKKQKRKYVRINPTGIRQYYNLKFTLTRVHVYARI
jgi:hypothetical protein